MSRAPVPGVYTEDQPTRPLADQVVGGGRPKLRRYGSIAAGLTLMLILAIGALLILVTIAVAGRDMLGFTETAQGFVIGAGAWALPALVSWLTKHAPKKSA